MRQDVAQKVWSSFRNYGCESPLPLRGCVQRAIKVRRSVSAEPASHKSKTHTNHHFKEAKYGQREDGFRSAKYRTSYAGHRMDAYNSRAESQSEQGGP